MFTRLLALICGLLGIATAGPHAKATDILGCEIKLEKKSFDEVSVGTQDFGSTR